MCKHALDQHPILRIVIVVFWLLLVGGAALHAQRDTVAFVTLSGTDTVGYEQYVRSRDGVTGTWISERGGVYLHDYAVTFGARDVPTHFEMRVRNPGGPKPTSVQTYAIDFGRDSATFTVAGDTNITTRVALANGYPVLGQSIALLELPLPGLRRAHVDSAIIITVPVTSAGVITRLPVKFTGTDSAIFAGVLRTRLGPDVSIIGMAAGALSWQRVPPIDMNVLVDRLVASSAARVAAEAAAQAARVEIPMQPTDLEKFVGQYAFTPSVSATVTRIENHLSFRLGSQQSVQLFAESPTRFFMKAATGEIQFEVDASGRVAALVLIQAGAKQRAARQ